jgi:hypothetical protein
MLSPSELRSQPVFSRPGVPAVLPPGSAVRVRNTLGSWASGFEVVGIDANGYLLRRTSDGAVLPTSIATEGVLKA